VPARAPRWTGLRAGWRASRTRLLELWLIGLIASVGVTLASLLGYLDAAQARSLDVLMRLRAVASVDDVVIVAIDDAAFSALGERQPLPRDYLARLIRGLRRSGAAVVGLDVDLATPTSPAAEQALIDAMTEFGDDGISRVVPVEPGRLASGPLAHLELRGRVLIGAPDIAEDDDGVIRRAPLAVRRGDRVVPTFAVAVVARLLAAGPAALERALQEPEARVVLARWRSDQAVESPAAAPVVVRPGELWRINFVGPARTFLTFPSETIAGLADETIPIAADNPLRGRIVLVGGTFQEGRDFYPTPLGRLSGVEIHANVIHMLGTRSFVKPSGWLFGLGVQLVLVLATGVLLVLVNPVVGTVASLGGALVLGIPASYLVFARGQYSIDFMLPVLAMRVMAWGVDVIDRPSVRAVLARFIGRRAGAPPADETAAAVTERGWTTLTVILHGVDHLRAEGVLPSDVASRLQPLRHAVRDAVARYGGTLEGAGPGDRARAVFAAEGSADHAACAVQAAIAIDEAVRALNQRWVTEGLAPLLVGMGIHTMTVPDTDAPDGLTEAASAIASEVEALGAKLGVSILITEVTRRALGDAASGVLPRGSVPAAGEGGSVAVYELVAPGP
jgi:adenylate cyclase